MSIISRVKRFWAWFKATHKTLPTEEVLMAKTYEVKECQRDAQTKKRVAAAFEAQKVEMRMRALKPHDCQDPITCEKDVCYTFAPDKIVSKPYSIARRKRRPKVQEENPN